MQTNQKLLLTSAALEPGVKEAFLEIVKKPQDLSVLFIPTAADPEDDKTLLEAAKNELRDLDIRFVEFDLKGKTPELIRRALSTVDMVYVNGGNTFYLLDWIKRSGFDQALPEFLDQGKLYFGVSAGSIVVGPDISSANWNSAWDKNSVGLTDLSGLQLIPMTIIPHYEESDYELVNKFSENFEYPVVALTDNQAIYVEGDSMKLVGQGVIPYLKGDLNFKIGDRLA